MTNLSRCLPMIDEKKIPEFLDVIDIHVECHRCRPGFPTRLDRLLVNRAGNVGSSWACRSLTRTSQNLQLPEPLTQTSGP